MDNLDGFYKINIICRVGFNWIIYIYLLRYLKKTSIYQYRQNCYPLLHSSFFASQISLEPPSSHTDGPENRTQNAKQV